MALAVAKEPKDQDTMNVPSVNLFIAAKAKLKNRKMNLRLVIFDTSFATS